MYDAHHRVCILMGLTVCVHASEYVNVHCACRPMPVCIPVELLAPLHFCFSHCVRKVNVNKLKTCLDCNEIKSKNNKQNKNAWLGQCFSSTSLCLLELNASTSLQVPLLFFCFATHSGQSIASSESRKSNLNWLQVCNSGYRSIHRVSFL